MPLRTQDLLFSIAPDSGANSNVGNFQCNGSVTARSASLPTYLLGNDGAGNPEFRYAITPDPKDGSHKAFYFSARATDPDTAGDGNKRCEFSYSSPATVLPWNEDFWFAVRVGTAHFDGSNDQQIVWQWHDGSGTPGLSPLLSAIVQGSTLKIIAIANFNDAKTQANSTKTVIYQGPWDAGLWKRFVVKARVDQAHPGNGFAKVWLDGAQVADYAGPLGFSYAASQDYVKVGVYHWTGAGNAWDATVPLRQVWIGETLLAHDAPGYTFETFDAYLQAKYPLP